MLSRSQVFHPSGGSGTGNKLSAITKQMLFSEHALLEALKKTKHLSQYHNGQINSAGLSTSLMVRTTSNSAEVWKS